VGTVTVRFADAVDDGVCGVGGFLLTEDLDSHRDHHHRVDEV
jgi:hypothetical protein